MVVRSDGSKELDLRIEYWKTVGWRRFQIKEQPLVYPFCLFDLSRRLWLFQTNSCVWTTLKICWCKQMMNLKFRITNKIKWIFRTYINMNIYHCVRISKLIVWHHTHHWLFFDLNKKIATGENVSKSITVSFELIPGIKATFL